MRSASARSRGSSGSPEDDTRSCTAAAGPSRRTPPGVSAPPSIQSRSSRALVVPGAGSGEPQARGASSPSKATCAQPLCVSISTSSAITCFSRISRTAAPRPGAVSSQISRSRTSTHRSDTKCPLRSSCAP